MNRIFECVLAAVLTCSAAIAGPSPKLDDPAIRRFMGEQGRSWNARDFSRFYATFDVNAVIVLVTLHRGKEVTRRVRTLAEDRRQAEHFFASTRAKIRETDQIERIEIDRDGRRACVRVKETARMVAHGRTKVSHAVTEQDLELRQGRILSLRLMEFDTQ